MPIPRFYYNAKTLRYERVKLSFLKVLFTMVGYLAFGAIFCFGLVLLQNYFVETPLEAKLRNENETLGNHKILLTTQLWQANQQLGELKKQDRAIYEKLFDTKLPIEKINTSNREDILLAGNSDFHLAVDELSERFTTLNKKARTANRVFSQYASVKEGDVKMLTAVPSMAPIEGFDVSKLVSGFGTRINPFHKGHYHHDGADIAAPRGTNIIATGPGYVIQIKKSDLLAGYGNYIEINHGNGYVTRYSHMEDITVRYGQRITKGQIIGTVGSSGGTIAPHLHYEVIWEGKNVDPLKFIVEGISAIDYQALVTKGKKQNQSLD